MTKISYDDFIEKARQGDQGASWVLGKVRDEDLLDPEGPKEAFAATWISGGVEGGNCWNDSGHYSLGGEEEPELDRLLDLLEEIDVSLREGRKIMNLVKVGTVEERGYYGNYTVYGYKFVAFDTVYDKLVEFGKAEPRPGYPTP